MLPLFHVTELEVRSCQRVAQLGHNVLYVRVKAAAETLPFPARADTECATPASSSPGVNPRLPRQKTEAPGTRVFSLECILPRDTLLGMGPNES